MASNEQKSQEDCAEYSLFPLIPEGVEVGEYLEEQLDVLLAHISVYVVDYIWQNEPFQLRVVPPTGSSPGHICGTTNYGDNVEDEWFIVYLLQQLTKNFTGLVAKISDNDGEFLLIEAADSIPKWLNPDTADNRIFLFGGKLHILPKTQTPGTPTLLEATAIIRGNPSGTRASDRVQRDIHRRLVDYPEKKHASRHRAHCYVPAALAAVLDHTPSLVAPIVQAFYYRDPIDLRSCITFRHFQPGTRIMREVRFTKCLYAQLMQQKFQADKRSGFNIPAPSNPKFKSHDLGMKLAHGAEILCSKCGPLSDEVKTPEQSSQNDVRWSRFVQSLSENGYFRGQLEGSKLYIKLLDEARVCFHNTVATSSRSAPSTGRKILETLGSVTYDMEEMRKEEKLLSAEDDDEWLNLSPEMLDDMLNKAMGKTTAGADNFNLDKMADSMKSFVDKVSSHEGAEFPKPENDDIEFDPNSFVQNMQKMFDFDDDDDGNSSSDMDEYGSDDDLADSLSPSSPTKKGPVGQPKLDLKDYMAMMDKELASTTIAESFKTEEPVRQESAAKPTPPPRKKKQERAAKKNKRKSNIDDLDDDFKPVNVDMNLVQNLLESYSSQDGMAGPTSNIMGSMGMKIPQDSKKK